MTEVIKLDPSAVASSRTEVEITSYIDVDGPDYGDADILAYMADQQVGSSPVDYRLPNRTIKIPLNLRNVGAVSFSTIRLQLQQKAALFQKEGGWLMRQVGSTSLYADVVNATLHLGGDWMQAYRSADVNAVLSLEVLPDWYGDEVALDTLTATGVLAAKLQQSAADAVVAGNHPGRCRIVVSDTSAHDQHALIWGIRSRHYDPASTAALTYEAEALSPLNGAATAAQSGASGGNVVQHTTLPGGMWVPTLATNLVSGNQPLTHTGSYRVFARVYSATATPQLKLLWGVGSLSVPVTNDTVKLPGAGAFYLVDLGPIHIDAPPVGSMQWFGVIQTQAAITNDPIAIDKLYFQPIDESAGVLTYTNVPPASSIQATRSPSTAANDAATGTIVWSNPTNVTAEDSSYATTGAMTVGQVTEWLKATGYGFSVPVGATIVGIQVTVYWGGTGTASITPRLVKAGTVQTGAPGAATTSSSGSDDVFTYPGPTSLWSGTWTPSDINNTGFGAAVTFTAFGSATVTVNYIQIAVFYTLASGFTVAQDAVVYASKTAELRTDGMFRSDAAGAVYGPVSVVTGDLPRLPTSGLESRPVELFSRLTRGDLGTQPDSGLDAQSTQVLYRPSYLFVGA